MKKLKLLISTLALSLSAMAQYPTNGLTSYYKFETQNLGAPVVGPILSSSSPTNVLLTSDSRGNSVSAVSFNNAYLNAPDTTKARFRTGSVSIAAWIYIPAFSGTSYHTVGGVRYNATVSPYNSYALAVVNNNQRVAFSYSNAGSVDNNIYSTTSLAPSTWYHVAATYDSTSHTAKLYVNGTLEASSAAGSGGIVYNGSSNSSLILGNVYGANGNAFLGRMDEVFTYNRALSATEITTIKNNTLIDYFKFNNGSFKGFNGNILAVTTANPVSDRAGNAAHAHYVASSANVAGGSAVIGMPQVNEDRTISLWFKRKVETTHTLFNYADASNSLSLVVEGNALKVVNGPSVILSKPLTYDTLWHHVALTHSAGSTTLYYDNVPSTSVATTYANNNTTVRLGRSVYGGDYVDYAIDDLYLYKSALSSTEITALYNAVPTSVKSQTTLFKPLVLYPSPSKNNITVTATAKGVLNIYSVEGKLMMQDAVNEGENMVKVADLPAGMYVATIVSEGAVQRTQFVKE